MKILQLQCHAENKCHQSKGTLPWSPILQEVGTQLHHINIIIKNKLYHHSLQTKTKNYVTTTQPHWMSLSIDQLKIQRHLIKNNFHI